MTASAAAKSFSHSISAAVTLACLTNLTQYVHWKGVTSKRRGSFWRRHGPTILCALAVPLVMLDLTRHLLQDVLKEIYGPVLFAMPSLTNNDALSADGLFAFLSKDFLR